MILLQALLILTPWLFFVLISLILDTSINEHAQAISMAWVVISPFWGVAIAFVFYWKGKTIEALETAKFAVETIKDNKHHAVSAFNFIKRKVKRGY